MSIPTTRACHDDEEHSAHCRSHGFCLRFAGRPPAEPANSSPDIKPLLEKAETVREWHRHNPGVGPNHRADSDQIDAPKFSDEELKRLTEYYRGEFPFRSLRDRLAYEKSLPPNRAEPKLNTAAKTWLKDEDEPNNDEIDMRQYLNYKDSLRS